MSKYATDISRFNEPEKEPEREWAKITLGVIAAIIIIIVIASFCGCSLEKKNSMAYKRAALGNPVTPKDSSYALTIAKKVIKEKPPKVIPGKTVQVPKIITKTVLDAKQRKHLLDSLTAVFKDADSVSKDYCIMQMNDNYNRGWDAGYATGQKDCPDSVVCPPVDCPADTALQLSHSQLENNYGILKDKQARTEAQAEIFKSEAKNNKFWLVMSNILWALVIGTAGYFILRGKLKAKTLTEIIK